MNYSMYIKFKQVINVLTDKIYYEIVGEDVDDPIDYNTKDNLYKNNDGAYHCFDHNKSASYYIIDIYSDEYEVFVDYIIESLDVSSRILGGSVDMKKEDLYNMVDSYVRDEKLKTLLD